MPELTDAQLIDLVKHLPPDRKRGVLIALASDAQGRRSQRMALAENRMRTLCMERGLNWDLLTEAEREALVDELVHEDRSCAR